MTGIRDGGRQQKEILVQALGKEERLPIQDPVKVPIHAPAGEIRENLEQVATEDLDSRPAAMLLEPAVPEGDVQRPIGREHAPGSEQVQSFEE
jgi:hypothetical protein